LRLFLGVNPNALVVSISVLDFHPNQVIGFEFVILKNPVSYILGFLYFIM